MMMQSFEISQIPAPLVYAEHRIIIDCNDIFASNFGYKADELIGSGFQLLYPRFDDFVRTGKIWKRNLAGEYFYEDQRMMQHRNGKCYWFHVVGHTQTPHDPFAKALYSFKRMAPTTSERYAKLTDRQMQVATLVSMGKTSAQIAQELALSRRTVEAHRARLMKALGIKNAAELSTWFHAIE